LKGYQLTFNNGEVFGYDFEALHDCDTCPTPHLEGILSYVYNRMEKYAVNFVALSMEKGSHAHIHAYVQLVYKPGTMAAWQKMFPGVHVEDCRGTPQQNMDYLAKAGKWENDVKHGTLKWGPFTYGEMLGSEQGCPADYVKLAMTANSFAQVFRGYPDAIRYSYAIKLIMDERRGTNNGGKQTEPGDDPADLCGPA